MASRGHLSPEQYAAVQVSKLRRELMWLVSRAEHATAKGRTPSRSDLDRIAGIKEEIKEYERGDFTAPIDQD
jgi:hypothetical protein